MFIYSKKIFLPILAIFMFASFDASAQSYPNAIEDLASEVDDAANYLYLSLKKEKIGPGHRGEIIDDINRVYSVFLMHVLACKARVFHRQVKLYNLHLFNEGNDLQELERALKRATPHVGSYLKSKKAWQVLNDGIRSLSSYNKVAGEDSDDNRPGYMKADKFGWLRTLFFIR